MTDSPPNSMQQAMGARAGGASDGQLCFPEVRPTHTVTCEMEKPSASFVPQGVLVQNNTFLDSILFFTKEETELSLEDKAYFSELHVEIVTELDLTLKLSRFGIFPLQHNRCSDLYPLNIALAFSGI